MELSQAFFDAVQLRLEDGVTMENAAYIGLALLIQAAAQTYTAEGEKDKIAAVVSEARKLNKEAAFFGEILRGDIARMIANKEANRERVRACRAAAEEKTQAAAGESKPAAQPVKHNETLQKQNEILQKCNEMKQPVSVVNTITNTNTNTITNTVDTDDIARGAREFYGIESTGKFQNVFLNLRQKPKERKPLILLAMGVCQTLAENDFIGISNDISEFGMINFLYAIDQLASELNAGEDVNNRVATLRAKIRKFAGITGKGKKTA